LRCDDVPDAYDDTAHTEAKDAADAVRRDRRLTRPVASSSTPCGLLPTSATIGELAAA
jgi:hypothetical protein